MSIHSPKGVDMNLSDNDPNTWSKSKKKRMRQKRKKMEEAAASSSGAADVEKTDAQGSNESQHKRQKTDSREASKKQTQTQANENVNVQMESDITTSMEGVSPIKSPKKKKKEKNKSKRHENDMDSSSIQSDVIASSSANKPNLKSDQSNKEQHHPTNNSLSKPKPVMMSTLQKTFLARLTSSRFRELNEELYTQPSAQSFAQFTSNPELFEQYHSGFRRQVEEWPVNPVDVIYKKIVGSFKKEKKREVCVADFGCGDAKLAERLMALQIDENGNFVSPASKKKKGVCPFKVHSFDLVSGGNPLVTPADMTNVPLADESVDIGVYCLALMGTNVPDFVREGFRVLKFGGILRVAEVRSRFETSNAEGGNKKKHNVGEVDSTKPLMILDDFKALMERCGFKCTHVDQSNTMFMFMDFVKVEGSTGLSEKESFSAKPCIYKRR
ncbi:hypothetical protein ACHAWO_008689 [Cyclotella atomus]|uniref:Ribosomal RNA-processing protein 8 n=1 Tax=Cyclotella atomus TaxID=382360 RepID=A0ABD3NA79_9STRA